MLFYRKWLHIKYTISLEKKNKPSVLKSIDYVTRLLSKTRILPIQFEVSNIFLTSNLNVRRLSRHNRNSRDLLLLRSEVCEYFMQIATHFFPQRDAVFFTIIELPFPSPFLTPRNVVVQQTKSNLTGAENATDSPETRSNAGNLHSARNGAC